MQSQAITVRRSLFAALLATAVACAAPEGGDESAMPEAEAAAEVVEAPPQPMADPADVASVDAIVHAVYEVISGDAGEARDWERWWVLTIFWQHEGDAGPIPDRYLDNP